MSTADASGIERSMFGVDQTDDMDTWLNDQNATTLVPLEGLVLHSAWSTDPMTPEQIRHAIYRYLR